MSETNKSLHRVVIIGGGFGGLYAAQTLAKSKIKVTLIDKRNFHVFQPLLYQVATGGLSPADISSPIRALVNRNKNIEVLMGEVLDIDPEKRTVKLQHKEITYDSLIVATGVTHQYFGNEEWSEFAPGLKTIEDALEIRRRIFIAFEAAEKETNPEKHQDWLTFAIIGAGPAGVELAGALAEVAHGTLKEDFRNIDTSKAKIMLFSSRDVILPTYPEKLSLKAQKSLERLGVTVITGARAIDIQKDSLTVRIKENVEKITAKTILWTAGMKASGMSKIIADRTGANLDRSGRVIVSKDFKVSAYENIFAIGDLARYDHQDETPLPGIAPVAMQEGQYVARLIASKVKGESIAPFYYFDSGSLAVIGKHEAVVDLGFIRLSGFLAWCVWMFIHVFYLLEFDNKLIVMIQWAWNYFTFSKGARLITTPAKEHPTIQLDR